MSEPGLSGEERGGGVGWVQGAPPFTAAGVRNFSCTRHGVSGAVHSLWITLQQICLAKSRCGKIEHAAGVVLAEANALGRRRRRGDRAQCNFFAKREIRAIDFRSADPGDRGSLDRRFPTGS